MDHTNNNKRYKRTPPKKKNNHRRRSFVLPAYFGTEQVYEKNVIMIPFVMDSIFLPLILFRCSQSKKSKIKHQKSKKKKTYMQKGGVFLMYKITENRNDKREPSLWIAGATGGNVTITEGPEPNDQQNCSNHIQQRCPKERRRERKITRRLAN